MQIIIFIVGVFVITVLCLALIAKIFSNTPVEFRTILAAALFMMIMLLPMSFVPILGWFIAVFINMMVLRIILECSMMEAFMAILLWGGTILIVLYFADQLSLINMFPQM